MDQDNMHPLEVALETIVRLEAEVDALERAVAVIAWSLAGDSQAMTDRIVQGLRTFAAKPHEEGRRLEGTQVYERLAQAVENGRRIVAGNAT